MTAKTPMPCAHDSRPLRITLFPEHPQTILIYVPEGRALWLPTLETPFDLDAVCSALDDHDVPHDTREGDRNRWWRNIKQTEDTERSIQIQRAQEQDAVRRVQIHLSPAATTLEAQRAEVIQLRDKARAEIRDLKVQIGQSRANLALNGIYDPPGVFHAKEQRLADLQTTTIALDRKLVELKDQQRQQRKLEFDQLQQQQQLRKQQRKLEAAQRHQALQQSREGRLGRFIEKVKRHLTREQYLALWAEIDAEDTEGSETTGNPRADDTSLGGRGDPDDPPISVDERGPA